MNYKQPKISLYDNIYNQQLRPDQPKFKLWSSAGLMLTYYCPSRCACCYNFSGPEASNPQTDMSVELALNCWRSIRKLAGQRGKVHITGGEPFCNYEKLKKILAAAQREKLAGLEKIETNAFWCTDAVMVRDRLQELKALGLTKLHISTDIYHQEYIPVERVRLAADIARDVLGPQRVQVRWRDFLDNPVSVTNMSSKQREREFAKELRKRPERLLGRAAVELVNLFNSSDYSDIVESNCKRALLGARHIHIDGAGNVFSGTCVGIVVGKLDYERDLTLEKLWVQTDYRQHPVFSVLYRSGPAGFVSQAEKLGYQKYAKYRGKCHLCFDVRQFLFQKQQYPDYLSPAVCYGVYEKLCFRSF